MAASAAEAPSPPIPAEEFPLVGWWGPPVTEPDLAQYAYALFNVVQAPPEQVDRQKIGIAGKLGLRLMLVYPQQSAASIDHVLKQTSNNRNIIAWLLADQLQDPQTASLFRYVPMLRDEAPHCVPFVPLPPSSATDTFAVGLEAVAEADMPILVKRFSCYEDGLTDETGFYTDLTKARRAAWKHQAPLWGAVQVTKQGNFRRASESDIRWQVYSYLAYGAQGLCYFNYWGTPPDTESSPHPSAHYDGAMVHPLTGRPQYGYEMVRLVHLELAQLWPHLKEVWWKGVYFFGDPPKNVPDSVGISPDPALARIEGQKGLVGMFEDKEGTEWRLLVNRRQGKLRSAATQKSTLQVFVRDGFSAISEIDRHTGMNKPIATNDRGAFYITLPGGTGSLLRFEPKDTD